MMTEAIDWGVLIIFGYVLALALLLRALRELKERLERIEKKLDERERPWA